MKKGKVFFIGLIVSLFVFLQIWCTYLTFNFPYLGIYLDFNSQQQWIIKDLDFSTSRPYLDVQIGDTVLLVDGKLPDIYPTVHKWHTIEQAHTLMISRYGHNFETTVHLNNSINYDLIPIIEELVCLFMVILLVSKMQRSPSAKILASVFLTMSTIFMCLGASVRGDTIGKIALSTLMMVLPVIFYHFLVIFFKEKENTILPKKILKFGYTISLIGFGLSCFLTYPHISYKILTVNTYTALSFFVIGFLYNMYILTALYFKVRKQQSYLSSIIKTVWLSIFISFLPITGYSFLPQMISGQWNVDARYTSWFVLFFPITFAYLIASDQLYDIGLVVRRVVFAAVVAIVPVSLFTGLFVFLFRHSTNESQIMFVFLGSLVLVASMLYATEYVSTRLEAFLFPQKHVLQMALKKISRNLGAISSFRELKDIILVDIVNTLQVTGGAIVFRYQKETDIIEHGEIDSAAVRELVCSGTIMQHPQYTCVEMNRHEAYTSYLVTTRKKTNTLLGKEEQQWLRLITSYLEVCLENVHLIRKLTVRVQQFASQLPHEDAAQEIQWFRKLMFELQEEERTRIATDLHDTTMQDLFFLKRRIVSIMEKSKLRQEDHEQLQELTNFVELINTGLRQSCFELNPHLLHEVGLIRTLRMYLDKEAITAPFELHFHVDQVSSIEGWNLQINRHLFRIVQELLNNAKKHSLASRVTFRITETGRSFSLQYEDDGVGFKQHTEVKKEIGGSGMGMEQMRSRILHMNGHLDLQTQEGSGTKLIITIPAREDLSA